MKTQKFYLFPHIYYATNSKNEILLYNTKNGEHLIFKSLEIKNIIEEMYNPQNLGAVDLSEKYIENKETQNYIDLIVQRDFGKIVELRDDLKFINLLPVLNLQDDIEKLKRDSEHEIGENAIRYLNELNIYINQDCKQNCTYCQKYYRQINSCFKTNDKAEISIQKLHEIFEQLQYSQLKNVNILGGNVLAYSHLEELLKLAKNYDFIFHFWVHFLNINGKEKILFPHFQEIIITFPLDTQKIINFVLSQNNNEKNTYHFFIENQMQYAQTEDIISQTGITKYQIKPIFTGENLAFFEDNVFLKQEDIFDSVVEQRTIFSNQKLNSNFFGKLFVLPNGNVKANINSDILGNIFENSVIELITKELTANSAWYKTRNEKPCSDCLYQFLCPPPSNYETVIGKTNLCIIE